MAAAQIEGAPCFQKKVFRNIITYVRLSCHFVVRNVYVYTNTYMDTPAVPEFCWIKSLLNINSSSSIDQFIASKALIKIDPRKKLIHLIKVGHF